MSWLPRPFQENRTTASRLFARTAGHAVPTPCPNCSTEFAGNFCPNCGQEARTGAPTAWEFLYEFWTHYLAGRGKLLHTLWILVRYPGLLTADFFAGRRERYVRPVRLYLTLSLSFFLVLSIEWLHASWKGDANLPDKSAAAKTGTTADKLDLDVQLDGLPANVTDNSAFMSRLQHFGKRPDAERSGFVAKALVDNSPKAMFFLLPVFALLLKGLYLFRRIPYGAYLLFAFHFHAFVFAVLLLTRLPLPGLLTGTLLVVSLPTYLMLALRRTFGSSWLGAFTKATVLMFCYSIVIVIALAGTVGLALTG